MEDAVLEVADAMRHPLGKGGKTTCSIEHIWGVDDWGHGEAFGKLFGPRQYVDDDQEVVEAMAQRGLVPPTPS